MRYDDGMIARQIERDGPANAPRATGNKSDPPLLRYRHVCTRLIPAVGGQHEMTRLDLAIDRRFGLVARPDESATGSV